MIILWSFVNSKVVRKEAFERRKVWKLDRRRREGVQKACDELCGKKKGRRDQGDTWWWNEDVKKVTARKKNAHKEMSKSGTEANKARYKNMN